jgi:hypothetical protein
LVDLARYAVDLISNSNLLIGRFYIIGTRGRGTLWRARPEPGEPGVVGGEAAVTADSLARRPLS